MPATPILEDRPRRLDQALKMTAALLARDVDKKPSMPIPQRKRRSLFKTCWRHYFRKMRRACAGRHHYFDDAMIGADAYRPARCREHCRRDEASWPIDGGHFDDDAMRAQARWLDEFQSGYLFVKLRARFILFSREMLDARFQAVPPLPKCDSFHTGHNILLARYFDIYCAGATPSRQNASIFQSMYNRKAPRIPSEIYHRFFNREPPLLRIANTANITARDFRQFTCQFITTMKPHSPFTSHGSTYLSTNYVDASMPLIAR